MSQELIHHLVAFPTRYFEAAEKAREIQDRGEVDGEGQYEYQQIERPDCLKGVCGFL